MEGEDGETSKAGIGVAGRTGAEGEAGEAVVLKLGTEMARLLSFASTYGGAELIMTGDWMTLEGAALVWMVLKLSREDLAEEVDARCEVAEETDTR